MDTVQDFEDILHMLEQHAVRYLIIGGLAFIYHAKPRYTKDIDLWIDPAAENVYRANKALTEDVIYRIYIRQAVDAEIKDSDEGRTIDVKEVRKRFGLPA